MTAAGIFLRRSSFDGWGRILGANFPEKSVDFLEISGIIIYAVDANLCKGSTTDSDSVCLGSNPRFATSIKAKSFARI